MSRALKVVSVGSAVFERDYLCGVGGRRYGVEELQAIACRMGLNRGGGGGEGFDHGMVG